MGRSEAGLGMTIVSPSDAPISRLSDTRNIRTEVGTQDEMGFVLVLENRIRWWCLGNIT